MSEIESQSFKLTFPQSLGLVLLYLLPALIVTTAMIADYHDRVMGGVNITSSIINVISSGDEKAEDKNGVADTNGTKEQEKANGSSVKSFIEKHRLMVEVAVKKIMDNGELKTQDDWNNALMADPQVGPILKSLQDKLAANKTNGNNTEILNNSEKVVYYYVRFYFGSPDQLEKGEALQDKIENVLRSIWWGNTTVAVLMSLFPFLLLGGRYSSSHNIELTFKQRLANINNDWWMKFVIAFILTYGWIYILNPMGRGASTIEQFLISVDLTRSETLPMFLKSIDVAPVIAGFLGWYLYMLTYFFSKMATNDVASTKVYAVMLQKFLFTWGVTIVFIAVEVDGVVGENANIMAFMIGFFPMAAFSLIKDKGMGMAQSGDKQEQGQLSQLPSITRWQILRLEEEGINSLGTLAYHPRDAIIKSLPRMADLVIVWADISRLHAITGEEDYQKIRPLCLTASEFVRRSGEEAFITALQEAGINNVAEIARLLEQTFPDIRTDLLAHTNKTV